MMYDVSCAVVILYYNIKVCLIQEDAYGSLIVYE